MAQGIPGNSHEVKIGLMPIKDIQALDQKRYLKELKANWNA